MSKINEFSDFHPLNRGEWRDWLAENYAKSSGIWFVYFKKHTGKPRVTYDEAVEEALCFGWIDSCRASLTGSVQSCFSPRANRKAFGRSRINCELKN
jgi:uncharacterized protein YdeI (YjbR/CyaY-like superfamily)